MHCKVYWHGTRCERSHGHTGTHTFIVNGERVKKTGSQVLQSANTRKVCNSSDKRAFREFSVAKMACIRWKLAKDLDLVPYLCPCGSFHLTSRYSEKETV